LRAGEPRDENAHVITARCTDDEFDDTLQLPSVASVRQAVYVTLYG
jgi:hypothetical protein